MKQNHDRKSARKTRQFNIGEKVKIRDYRGGDPRKKKMINGIVIDKLGPVRYSIDVGYTIYNRHVDQMEKIGQNVFSELQDNQLDILCNDNEQQVEQVPVNHNPRARPPVVVHREEAPRRSSRVKKPNRLINNDSFVLQ